jgi:hypothetical protein
MAEILKLDLDAYKLIEAHRSSIAESQLSIVKRVLKSACEPSSQRASSQHKADRKSRETGKFVVRLHQRTMIMGSQKAAYIQLLRWLNEDYPDLFETLARTPSSRGRLTVARTKAALYPRADLQIYAEEIEAGWFADLNLSKAQKIQRLRKACAEAGLTYGVEADAGF